jgi:hypothetical protein
MVKQSKWRPKGSAPSKRKLELMRQAKTEAENRFTISGRVRPIRRKPSLPKTPWDEEP